MTTFAAILCLAAAAVVVGHYLLCWPLLPRLWRWRQPLIRDNDCPRTAVILCLRGSDPFLPATLRALLQQDYPSYDVRLVVDDRADPAWSVADAVVRETAAANVTITPLTDRRPTCSLTCSSFLQAVTPLLETHEVVVSVDADVVPHRTWLRELVAPLADRTVGLTTGNRWYWPSLFTWGSLVRYYWNVPAVAQMALYGIAWAGSMALRSETVRACGLLEVWGKALVHDVPLYSILQKHRLRLAFVPSLLMVNRETIPLADFFTWVQRQLLLPRLYHPHWWAIVGHALVVSFVPAALLGTLLAGWLTGNAEAALWCASGLVGYTGGLLVLAVCLDALVRRIVRGRGEPTAWVTGLTALAALPAFFLTHALYPAALLGTMCRRTISWRGISYRVDGPWQIQLLEYRPFKAAPERPAAPTSL